MNHRYPADPVGRVAVHTLSQFGTRDVDVQPLGVEGRCHILYPVESLLNIFNDFIIAGNKDHLSGAKVGGIDTVSDPVNVDQFSVQGDGIDTAKEEIRGHLGLPDLENFFFWQDPVSNGHKSV